MFFARPPKLSMTALLAVTALIPTIAAHAAVPTLPSFAPSLFALPPAPASAGAVPSLFSPSFLSLLPSAGSQSLPWPAPLSLMATSGTPVGWGWIWNRGVDPSLRLSDWESVLNVARLGVYAVPLRDDPAERANILLAARAVDNSVVLPGGTFSFNSVVGERTPERGFMDGLMFDSGRIVRGTGGGICLVSTGLYNAALQAGLTITERHGHSGVVTYAAPGCDASVVYGSEDMQFVNTTWQPITVKAVAGVHQVLVSLYGAPPLPGSHVWIKTTALSLITAPVQQTVDIALPPGSAPVIDQKPRAGYHVVVQRVWTRAGQIVRRETVADETRAPRPKIMRVAPPVPATPAVPDATTPATAPNAAPVPTASPALPSIPPAAVGA